MKTLHIVRHGKALQSDGYIKDEDRPLIAKGIANNILVAKKLLARFTVPDLIISSFAARALQTAHIFAREMGYPHENVKVSEKLYFQGDSETYDILAKLPDTVKSVMIVGHNPDLTYVAYRLGAGVNDISTSGVVTICFETDAWSNIENTKIQCSFTDKYQEN